MTTITRGSVCGRLQRLVVALQLQLTNESAARGELQRKLCLAVREQEEPAERQTDALQGVHAPTARRDAPAARRDVPAEQR